MSDTVIYPSPGCVVEYIEGNIPHIALVLEEQSGKARLLLPSRREVKIMTARLLPWAGPLYPISGREAALPILEQHRTRRESMATALDIVDVWRTAQGEMTHATARWFAELCADNPDADTIAAYGRALLACKSHFKFQPPHFEIYPATTVEQRLAEQESLRQRELLVSGGAAFFRTLFDVYNKKRGLPAPDDPLWPAPHIVARLERMLLQRIADPESPEDDTLWRMLVKGLPDVAHIPLHLAMAWGLVPAHHNFWLDRAAYSPGDSWAVEHTAQIDALVCTACDETLPMLSLPFVSIDSATTRDVDDAFYIEVLQEGGYRLHLALACPALHWSFESALDKAVARRATSIYLPETTHHMLPEALGIDVFSLHAGVVRPVLCCVCDMGANGSIESFTPLLAKAQLAANLTFEDCEAVLEGNAAHDNPATPFAAQMCLAETVALLRQSYRIANGAVIMERPDPKITLVGEGADINVLFEEDAPAPRTQQLVAELMILINAACARYGQEQDIPLIHRTQDVAIPKEYAGIWTAPHDMARMIRALVPSCLEVQQRTHAALAVPGYSPITSPLRRYTDLLNEAQIVHYLNTGQARLQAEDLKTVLPALNARLDVAGQVQRFRPRYWKLLYVRQQGDKIWWDAVVTEENDKYCHISLPREQITVRGQRHLFGERVCAGQNVCARLGKVNPLYNEISILEVADM